MALRPRVLAPQVRVAVAYPHLEVPAAVLGVAHPVVAQVLRVEVLAEALALPRLAAAHLLLV